MGLTITFWFKIYGCFAVVGLVYLLIGIFRRRSRHSWVRGSYGIDTPYSIIEYFSYTIAALISPFSLVFALEFIWNPLHWLASVGLLMLSWSIAFMPGFIFVNIIYSSLVTKYEMYNRLLHTISRMKLDSAKHPVTRESSKSRRGEARRVHRNEFAKSEFKWVDNPFNAWQGQEQVLEIGCGAGLLTAWIAGKYLRDNTISAMQTNSGASGASGASGETASSSTKQKKKKSSKKVGKVTVAEVWKGQEGPFGMFGYSRKRAEENCLKENVSDFVELVELEEHGFETLPFKSNSFDVVVSALTIHKVSEGDGTEYGQVQRSRVIQEAVRVAKKGAIIAFYDSFISEEYVKELIAHPDIRSIEQSEELPGFYQAHIITAYKV